MRLLRDYRLSACHARDGDTGLHAHVYRVRVVLEGPLDPATGFVVDCRDVDAAVAPLLASLEHRVLDPIVAPGEAYSLERLAAWLCRMLAPALPSLVRLDVRTEATGVSVRRAPPRPKDATTP